MTNESTERVRKVWESQADKWFELRQSLFTDSRPIHEWMVSHLEPRAGQRVLEIASGPGETGFLAAPLLGSGRLVCTDIAQGMVDAARKRGAELGIGNVDYRVLDAQAMDLADASFNGILCRWGFMLMPDPAAAFRECRRVLVPGGRLVFAVFTAPQENPFASIPGRILVEQGLLAPSSAEWNPGILALADRSQLQALLDGANFASTHIEAVDMAWKFADADAYWNWLLDVTALGPLIRSLPDAARSAVRATVDQRLEPFAGANGI